MSGDKAEIGYKVLWYAANAVLKSIVAITYNAKGIMKADLCRKIRAEINGYLQWIESHTKEQDNGTDSTDEGQDVQDKDGVDKESSDKE